MSTAKKPPKPEEQARIRAELNRDRDIRRKSYRGRALELFPHICGRCKREFSGKRLKELTVHHRDHNSSYNPNDGSNWELLCIYCHGDEHEKTLTKGYVDNSTTPTPTTMFNPFATLDETKKPDE
jgi:hypothetical protein